MHKYSSSSLKAHDCTAGDTRDPLIYLRAVAPHARPTLYLSPRTPLTDHRIPYYHQHSSKEYMDVLRPNMSGSEYFGDPNQAWNTAYWSYNEPVQPVPRSTQELYPTVPAPQLNNYVPQQPVPFAPSYTYNTQDYNQIPSANFQSPRWYQASWTQPGQQPMPQVQHVPQVQQVQRGSPAYNFATAAYPTPRPSITAPTASYLTPGHHPQPVLQRHNSATSNPGSIYDRTVSEVSRSVSPNPNAIADYGYKNTDGTWSCAWPGCTSRSRFTRACDLRKHYKRHSKTLFCRHEGCPQSTEGGFSSKKDRARHEAKHNPMITCEWENCGRLFSRVDNMVRL
jgi:hypothetical protein